jgi:hypothetical protein
MIAAVSGLLLFIVMFFNWFGISAADAGDISIDNARDLAGFVDSLSADRVDINAWQAFSFIDIILLIAIVAAIGLAGLKANSQSVNMPVAASAITAGLGILATILVLFRIIVTPYDLGRDFFVWVGLILAAGIAYGGWMAMQEEGTSFSAQADRLQSRPAAGAGGGSAATGSAPGTGTEAGSSAPPPPPPPPPAEEERRDPPPPPPSS